MANESDESLSTVCVTLKIAIKKREGEIFTFPLFHKNNLSTYKCLKSMKLFIKFKHLYVNE